MKIRQVALTLSMLIAVLGVSTLPHAWADDGFIVYSQNNILTIFKLQTEDMPFLASGAKFLITPNPFSHTAITNSTNYNIDLGGWALIIADNDPLLDSDPMLGVLELVGVKPGAYSVVELSGPAGFITNDTPGFAEIEDDKIATAFSSVQVFSTPINFASAQNVVVPTPAIDNSQVLKLQTFGAKIGSANLNSDNLPPAMITNSPSNAKPAAIVFTNAVNGQQNANSLFDALGIPTYSVPLVTSGTGGFFVPPPFISPDSNGGKLVFTPKLDNVHSGLKLNMNLRGQDLGSTKFALDELNVPIGVEGQDVGFKVKVQDTIPAGMPPSPLGEAALFLSVDTTGSIDFGNSASFVSMPTVTFKVKRTLTGVPILNDGCPDVRMYLRNPTTNTWTVLTQPARNPSGDDGYNDMCSYIQTLPHFSDYVVSGNDGSVPAGSGSGGHGGHGGGSNGGTSGGGHSGHGSSAGSAPALQPSQVASAWNRVEIGGISFTSPQGTVSTPKVGQQIKISAQIMNTIHEHQPYVFIVQVLDKNGFTASIAWVEGHLDHGQTLEQSRSWTPEYASTYRISVMVWDGVDLAPVALSDKATMTVQVEV